MSPKTKKLLLPVVVTILLFLLFISIGYLLPKDAVVNFVQSVGPFGPVVLVGLFWLANFFAPLSGSPFLFAGYYFYGSDTVWYATASSILASVTNFLVAKKWGRPLVAKLAGAEALEKADEFVGNKSMWMIFVIRVISREAHDVISYAFGLTPLKFRQYFPYSTLGLLTASLLWYLVVSWVDNAYLFTIASWILFYIPFAGYAVYLVVKRIKNPPKC